MAPKPDFDRNGKMKRGATAMVIVKWVLQLGSGSFGGAGVRWVVVLLGKSDHLSFTVIYLRNK